MALNFGQGLFRTDERIFKQILRGSMLDNIVQGNSEPYTITGPSNKSTFDRIGTMGVSGTFRNLIVNIGNNTTGNISDSVIGVEISTAGGVSDLKVNYGDNVTGTKSNEQNELHVNKGEKVGISCESGEDSNMNETISFVSWSVDFFEDEIETIIKN